MESQTSPRVRPSLLASLACPSASRATGRNPSRGLWLPSRSWLSSSACQGFLSSPSRSTDGRRATNRRRRGFQADERQSSEFQSGRLLLLALFGPVLCVRSLGRGRTRYLLQVFLRRHHAHAFHQFTPFTTTATSPTPTTHNITGTRLSPYRHQRSATSNLPFQPRRFRTSPPP